MKTMTSIQLLPFMLKGFRLVNNLSTNTQVLEYYGDTLHEKQLVFNEQLIQISKQ